MIKRFELNKKGRDFVVGDIHGCFTKLKAQLISICFDGSKDRLFAVGDLVDRGNDSEDCIKWLDKSWFHSVRGNHEQMAIDTFYGDWDAGNYFVNGGAWFFGLTHEEQQCYVDLFMSLPIIIEVETKNGLVGIVHAEYPVNDWKIDTDNLDKNFIASCQWSRSRIEYNDTDIVKNVEKIYCGHTPVPVPMILGNHYYIDTGAVFGHELTIIEI